MLSDLGLTGIDHPAIAVKDVDKMADWYCDVLGYAKYFRHEKPIWILRATDNSLLEVMPVDDTPRPERTILTAGWSHLALRVKNIEQAIAHLDSHNVTWTSEQVEAIGGGRVRTFADPDGNLWQVVERIIS